MEIHQLVYVLAVAKYHNFTRAAEEVKTSQSSLSQQINKLEIELGISLFVRTTRSVQLTPAGSEFVKHAHRIMSEVGEARKSIQDYVTIVKGNLTLGVIPIIGYYRFPNLLASFQKNFPGVKMRILEEQCEELLSMLHSLKIDAAIVHRTSPATHFQFHHLISDHMVVVTSDHHPLASRKSVHIKELINEKFILTPPASGHYHDFLDACHAAGFQPNVLMNCSYVRTMLGLVREELGITVLSATTALKDMGPGLTIMALNPTIDRNMYLALLKDTDLPATVKMFKNFALQWVNPGIRE